MSELVNQITPILVDAVVAMLGVVITAVSAKLSTAANAALKKVEERAAAEIDEKLATGLRGAIERADALRIAEGVADGSAGEFIAGYLARHNSGGIAHFEKGGSDLQEVIAGVLATAGPGGRP